MGPPSELFPRCHYRKRTVTERETGGEEELIETVAIYRSKEREREKLIIIKNFREYRRD